MDATGSRTSSARLLILVLLALAVACLATGAYLLLSHEDPLSGGEAPDNVAAPQPPGPSAMPDVVQVEPKAEAPKQPAESALPALDSKAAPAPKSAPAPLPSPASASAPLSKPETASAPGIPSTGTPPVNPLGPAGTQPFSPVVTSGNITFVVPKTAKDMGSLNVAAVSEYLDEVRKTSPDYGPSARELIGIKFPWVPAALKAADIELSTDPVELAYFFNSAPYSGGLAVALEFRHPERTEVLVRHMYSSDMFQESGNKASIETPEPGHVVAKTTKPDGSPLGRLDVWVVPVDLSSLPDPKPHESKSIQRARKVTHVLVVAMKDGHEDAPPPQFLSGDEAREAVSLVERLLLLPSNRVAMIWSKPDEPLSSFQVKEAVAILAFPPATVIDRAAGSLGFSNSPSLALDLTLDKPPADKDIQDWITMLEREFGPMLQQVAPLFLGMEGMGKNGDALIKGLGELVKAAFDYKIDGSKVRFSLTTMNISESEIKQLESKFQGYGI